MGAVWCMNCGSRDVEVSRPGSAEGLADWLRFGGSWRPARRVCRRCGATSGARSHAWLRPVRGGWWSVPLRLLQALRRHRAMAPAPYIYLAAAVAGTVLGAAVQATLGWPWWLLAAGLVAAVWLFFASTAFWAGGRSSPSLGTELLRVVNPGRAMARDRRREVERLRAAPFPLYGLPPTWRGPRHLGGWEECWSRGRRRAVTTAIDLAHGDPLADQGPVLRVEVRVDPEGDHVPAARSERLRSLAEKLWFEADPPVGDPASHLPRSPPHGGAPTRPGPRSSSRWTAGRWPSTGWPRAVTGSPTPT